MTNLQNVQESITGTTVKTGEELSSLENLFVDPPAEVTTAPVQQYAVFRLVKKNQRRLTLDGICHDVKNPTTSKFETARLIRGASSIWTSELTELLKDKDYVNKNRVGLHFEDGICRVGMHELTKLEFARVNRHNVGKMRSGSGKYDYYEYDAAEEQKLRHEKQLNRIKTIQLVTEMQEEKMKMLALFLGIKPNDEEIGLPRSPDGFRTELLILADTKPDLVTKYLNSSEVEVSYAVRRAIMETKIDLGGQTGSVTWAGTGGFIGKIPSSRKPLEYLTELALTNSPEGMQFKAQLQSILK